MANKGVEAKTCYAKSNEPISLSAVLESVGLDPNPEYAAYEDKPEEDQKGTKDLRDKADDTKDRPTTADGDKGTKDLPSVLNKVGQNAVHLQNMYPMMSSVISLLASLSSNDEEEPTNEKKIILEDALVGALSILINKYGYYNVITQYDFVLSDDNIIYIKNSYRQLAINAYSRIDELKNKYGIDGIPLYEYNYVTEIGPEQTPLVTIVPDMYTQQYYTPDNDPYTGYIKWVSYNRTDYVYTIRTIGDKYFVSAKEEIYSIVEDNISETLDPYIEDQNLTAAVLNDLLIEQNKLISSFLSDKTLGKGSGANTPAAQQLIQMLLGFISTATNSQKNTQLPFSVLNQISVNESLKKYEKRQAEHKKMIKDMDDANIPVPREKPTLS